ncbi:MAG: hypothetical protein R3A79_04545 [Nannocystaceae bacterium]
MTLSELGKLTTGELGKLLKTLTIGDLLSADVDVAAPPLAASTSRKSGGKRGEGRKRKAAKKAEAAPTEVETRTAAGRERYDKSVFAAIEGAESPISAEELRAKVGGTPLQARASLARLINAGTVTWEGKARGTRYSVVSG